MSLDRGQVGMFVAAIALFAFVAFIVDNGPERPDGLLKSQVVMSVIFLLLGYVYYRFREGVSKTTLGLLAILAGIVSNWVQAGKLLARGSDIGERFIFLCAGVAVIAHGLKQLKPERSAEDVATKRGLR